MTGSRSFVRGACAVAALLAHVAAARPTGTLPAGAVPASGMDAIVGDWLIQDAGREAPQAFKSAATFDLERRAVDRAMEEAACDTLAAQRDALVASEVPGHDPRWRELYVRVCEARRRERLARLVARYPRIVFTKHYNLGGSHYAYTEGQSDAQAERHFVPGAALCVLSMHDGMYGTVDVLLEDPGGVIRDPDVSYDGTRILFAWKKSLNEDDYHLYEMDVATRAIRQLTFGLGFADYEGVYLPGGDIMFNSTRCVQTVDCWWTEVSNLYVCDGDGRHLRRVGFDQVHTNYPQVLADGRVIYTRWDYNDRGQIYPQPLFVMNPDGTGQREYYGNNSWWPTTVGHARGIPGSEKLIAIATGHHSIQTGALIVIDARKGRQETSGATLVAPRVDDKSDRRYRRVDAYVGFDGHFMHPYPLCEQEYIVSYSAHETRVGTKNGYALYLVREDGARELLAHDPDISCNQPVPLAPRPLPLHRPDLVDYRRTTGTYYAQDIYAGEGLRGVPRGTIRKLRVVALDYRAAGVDSNGNNGPAGGALVSTPVAIDNGTWDVKIVLGEAQVHADGSVFFEAPARTPLYFQAVDGRGFVAQSMRTWSTLMPGENMSCVGCHDAKSSVPPAVAPNMTLALAAGPQELEPFYGPPRGFSFRREIQPILDRHCVGCHKDGSRVPRAKGRSDRAGGGDKSAFSLRDATGLVSAGRAWSEAYLALTLRGKPHRTVHWLNVQSVPPMLPPYTAGSASSELMTMLEAGHEGVSLSREELDKIACWIDLLVPYCGDYMESHAWSERDVRKYTHFLEKRRRMEAFERRNIEDLIAVRTGAGGRGYRNLALNPDDAPGLPGMFPHATASSEHGGRPEFRARNAINGRTDNRGHGPGFPSWTPDKRSDAWWKVQFGGTVAVDRLVIHIRADFPHDSWWREAAVEFSDGTSEVIRLEKTPEAQTFSFPRRLTGWVRLTGLVPDESSGWCGFTEVEVWGES